MLIEEPFTGENVARSVRHALCHPMGFVMLAWPNTDTRLVHLGIEPMHGDPLIEGLMRSMTLICCMGLGSCHCMPVVKAGITKKFY